MPRSLVAVLSFSLALAAGCTPRAVIPDAERQRVTTDLAGQQRWLRVAVWVTPFWGDRTKVLLTDVPADELDLVEDTGGHPVAPPPPERILLPGTAVRIRDVEFPTGWIIAKRVVMSPRYHPWVLMDRAGDDRTSVIVLSQTAANFDEVRAEVDRLLTTDDPAPVFSALPPEQRDAIGRKELLEGMGPRAVEMAWGLPERRKIDRPASTEEWAWPGGKRRAFFQEDRLVRWEK
jgi:hypothetical protein